MKNFTQNTKSLSMFVCMMAFAFSASAATILSETFSTSLGNFTAQSLVGDQIWAWNTSGYAKMTGFVSKVNNANDDWLISPSMDFSDVTKANLSFFSTQKYGVNIEANLQLMVSDSYTGGTIDTTKWTSVAFTHNDGTSWTFVSSGLLAMDSYAGKENVHFAFRYKSSTTAGATWEVKNVLVETPAVESVTVLDEKFTNFTIGTNASPDGTDISASLDSYTGIAGWTGYRIYQAGGAIKMSSKSSQGYIVTPAVNLSDYSGKFYLNFDAMAWSGDTTHILVYLDDVLVKEISGLPNSSDYKFSSFGPYEISGGTATSKIKLIGSGVTGGYRFFIDNFKISQGAAPVSASAALTSATFSVENGKTQSKDLTLNAKDITGTLFVVVSNNAGSAFSTTISEVTAAQAIAEGGFTIPITYAPANVGKDTAEVFIMEEATKDINGDGVINNNDRNALTSSVITGEAWVAVEVADLASLRAANVANPTDKTTVYKLTGECVVTMVSGSNGFIQDATGGVMIYDQKGILTNKMAIGDATTGVTGTLDLYGQALELIPVADATVSSTGHAIVPVTLTIPEAKANKERYESTLVLINGLSNATSNVYWGTSKKSFNFVNGTDTIVVRTNYTGLDYMTATTAIPTVPTNYAGILCEYNGTVQLFPRSSSDIGYVTALNNVEISNNIYGSNGVLNVVASQGQKIEVYNILGRKLISTVANEGLNTFNLGHNQIFLIKVGKLTSKVVL